MQDVINQYVAGIEAEAEEKAWIHARLVSAVSVNPNQRPTASELKSVFHVVLNAVN
jgi:hypothetical protein